MRDRVGVWAVVRVKRFTNAKSRLASPVLGCGERRELARRMFEDVLEALSRCQDVLAGTIVVTDVLSPIALWGLTSLYPVGHSSIFSRASSRSKKKVSAQAFHRTGGIEALHIRIVGRLDLADTLP